MKYALLAIALSGCALFSRGPGAIEVADYKFALDACREDGKRAGSYAVYEQCAREADVRFGLKDGGAP